MQPFDTRSFACMPIQGGFYQRQDAIKPVPYELNDFIQRDELRFQKTDKSKRQDLLVVF
jgi:hypothetical protein